MKGEEKLRRRIAVNVNVDDIYQGWYAQLKFLFGPKISFFQNLRRPKNDFFKNSFKGCFYQTNKALQAILKVFAGLT